MRHAVLVMLALAALVAPPAYADLTMTMTMSMNAGPMVINTTMTTRVKGLKSRVDAEVMQQETSMLLDLASKQQWMLNHGTKEVTAVAPGAGMANMPVTFGDPVVTLKPNGQTKEVLGRSCKGYALELSIPMTLNEEALTLKMSGTIWAAGDGPGVEEYRALSRAAAEAGFATLALAQGPQGRGLLEMQKVLAEAGIPYAQEIQMVMEGTGQMAAMMAQMGAMSMTTTVTAISTDPIPDETFAIPAGYTKK